MSWFPTVRLWPWIGCEVDGEVEGRAVSITWGRWTLEISVGRHNGRFR